ncbi:transaldolase [bacterium]|uniref:Transaldolase n=1 Tax=candidate division WWE3 bacterium CG22_combo_CG10-13_8_21_14_all_39_12 TaxID=1975094 RepID=A0A2H0BEF5_UNCKA|nr:transaldolase [bacterium]PIP56063.1 MAG: transaldolase [candidate division WWE3 bacterium CG22_combo_CG10-13_8_21_14_all_39_12]
MKPAHITTNIYLDGGNPKETKLIVDTLGFLDGQTTNPAQIAKALKTGKIYSNEQLLVEYKNSVSLISQIIPGKLLSLEVYADESTTSQDIIDQAKHMSSWTPNTFIKIPCTAHGLKAAQSLTSQNVHVHISLVFTQEQAAASYSATTGAPIGGALVSPFEGCTVDTDVTSIDVITNIQKMLDSEGDEHMQVLMANIRDLEQFYYALYMGFDAVAVPFEILMQWHSDGMLIPGVDIPYDTFESTNEYLHAQSIMNEVYENLDLEKDWTTFNISHPRTIEGLKKFSEEWNDLVDR